MAFEFRLPDIGEGVVEGEMVAWHVKMGDAVKEDDPLFEVMTDKAQVVIPSPVAGKVIKTHGKEGEIIKVGDVIVEIEAKESKVTGKKDVKKKVPATVSRETSMGETDFYESKIPAEMPPRGAVSAREALATPAVRKLAREMDVDLARVPATGPRGRVTKDDVRRFADGAPRSAQAASRPDERVPFIGLRRKIAERMAQSKRNAAHFTYVDEVDMTQLVALRNTAKADAAEKGVKLSYLPFIMKALVPAFRKHPIVNSTLDGETLVIKHHYDIGISVDTPDGLIVPVIKNTEQKSILHMARELQDLVEKVRSKRASVQELTGSTFTITSVGNFGGMFATPIINYPEAAILGVNRIHERPVVRDGQIVVRKMMYLAISLDHRIVDGAVGARFLNVVKRHLENPGLLLLEAE